MAESQHTGALKASLHSCGSTPRRKLPRLRTTTYSGRPGTGKSSNQY